MADQPLFGSPAVSPTALQTRRNLAAALQLQGQDTSPIRSPWQGVARMAQSAMGGYEGYLSDQAELQARQSSAQNLAQALQGGNQGAAVAAMSDPFTNPEAAKLVTGLLQPQMIDTGLVIQPSNRFGQPIGPPIPKTIISKEGYGRGYESPVILQGTQGGGYRELQSGGSPGGVPTGGAGQPAPTPMPAPQQPAPQAAPPGPVGQGGIMPGGEQILGGGPALPVSPGIAAKAQWAAGLEAQRAGMTKTAQDIAEATADPIKTDIKRGNEAQDVINTIDIISDAYRSGGPNISGGPFGKNVLAMKQAVNQAFGIDLGGLKESEIIDKMNLGLSTKTVHALTSRGTQMELTQGMKSNPGLLMSNQGAQYQLSLMRQMAMQDKQLSVIASQATNPQQYQAVKQQFYQTHPLISPFTGQPLVGPQAVAQDMLRLRAQVGAGGGGGTNAPPAAAVAALRQNPSLRAQFDAKYGQGASSGILSGQ